MPYKNEYFRVWFLECIGFCNRERNPTLQHSASFWQKLCWREMPMHLRHGKVYGSWYIREHEAGHELKFSCQLQFFNVVCWLLIWIHCCLRHLFATTYICAKQTVQLQAICVFYFTFASPHVHYPTSLCIELDVIYVESTVLKRVRAHERRTLIEYIHERTKNLNPEFCDVHVKC